MVFHVWYCQCRILCAVSLYVIWMSDKLSFVVFVHSPTLRYLSVYACLERLNHLFCCVKRRWSVGIFSKSVFSNLGCSLSLLHQSANLEGETNLFWETNYKCTQSRTKMRISLLIQRGWWWSPSLPFLETIFFVNPSWYNLKFKWLSSIIHGQALQRHQLLQSQSETWEKIQNKQKSKKRKYS